MSNENNSHLNKKRARESEANDPEQIELPPKNNCPDLTPEENKAIDRSFSILSLNSIRCCICNKVITKQILFMCDECSTDEKPFLYCIDCLESRKHLKEKMHEEYRIVDLMKFPIFTTKWRLRDEIKLINSIQVYGLENWEQIGNGVEERGRVECESHYYSFYYKGKGRENYLPSEDDVILQNIIIENTGPIYRRTLENEPNNADNNASLEYNSSEINSEMLMDDSFKRLKENLAPNPKEINMIENNPPAMKKVEDNSNDNKKEEENPNKELDNTNKTTRNSIGYRYVYKPEVLKRNEEKDEAKIKEIQEIKLFYPENTKRSEDNPKYSSRGAGFRRSRRTNLSTNNQTNTAAEILGYLPLRNEFDMEFLNDAELEIAELEFEDNDTEEERNLKYGMLKIYNEQLEERKKRKDFIIQNGLLDIKRENAIESKMNKDDREILNFMKPFARFYNNSDFWEVQESLSLEKDIKQKIYQLKAYQSMGIQTMDDLAKYLEVENKKNLTLTDPNSSRNFLGKRILRHENYHCRNLNFDGISENIQEEEENFVKCLPLAASIFWDIAQNVHKIALNFKNQKEQNAEEYENKIKDLINSYDLEKKFADDVILFFNNIAKKLIEDIPIIANEANNVDNELND